MRLRFAPKSCMLFGSKWPVGQRFSRAANLDGLARSRRGDRRGAGGRAADGRGTRLERSSASPLRSTISSPATPCATTLRNRAESTASMIPARMPMRASRTKSDKRSPPRWPRKAAAKPATKSADRARRIAATLAQLYPEARISLDFATPWQCLAATILSAQCTDERVNRVTPDFFRLFPDAPATAAASRERMQELIVTTGFFRQKAKSLQAAAQALVDRFGGRNARSDGGSRHAARRRPQNRQRDSRACARPARDGRRYPRAARCRAASD